MSSAKRIVTLGQICTRQYCNTAELKTSSFFKKLKATQAKFQVNDGLPVFLKGGLTDKILYQVTFGFVAVGTGMMLKLFWDLAVPKK